MKITKKKLEKIIMEEIRRLMMEDWDEDTPLEDDDGHKVSWNGPLARRAKRRRSFTNEPDPGSAKDSESEWDHVDTRLGKDELESVRSKSAEAESELASMANVSSAAGMIDKIQDLVKMISNVNVRLSRLESSRRLKK